MAISQTLTDTFLQDCLDGAQNLGTRRKHLKDSTIHIKCILGCNLGKLFSNQ